MRTCACARAYLAGVLIAAARQYIEIFEAGSTDWCDYVIHFNYTRTYCENANCLYKAEPAPVESCNYHLTFRIALAYVSAHRLQQGIVAYIIYIQYIYIYIYVVRRNASRNIDFVTGAVISIIDEALGEQQNLLL